MTVDWSSLVHPVRVLLHVLRQVGLLRGREEIMRYGNVVDEISGISLELRERLLTERPRNLTML